MRVHMLPLYEIIIEAVLCANVIIYRILLQVDRWPFTVNSYYQTANTSTFIQKEAATLIRLVVVSSFLHER